MNFYSYDYLVQQNSQQNIFYLSSVVVVAIVAIVMGALWWRQRTELKYRDLFVIMMLLLFLVIGSQVNEWQNVKNEYNQKSQVIRVIQSAAREKHVKKEQVWANTTNITNGMLIKVKQHFYKVEVSDDSNSFTLSKSVLINRTIHYVRVKN
ncbi:DUF3290 family protein [Liquorilactobacillus mali]|uniref:DUF3290 domain-containing protein n=1 Tax=Liquorilactobacillus mali KCTC 3596 = DSM 20444 TaxID=1046596 RepID=J1F5G1_9LACO|nr:DUF3290 family protein [Liquorilactobacillus mali]EJF01560.1 hypothetical protein LMA_01059 [Liquorilactobacillus mali KCTC 3596 = DSM 20444]KRN10582.1 hypothetical protein FD00_GL002331 [Liquorilactobacillus mali KCTC 3596 = DSM 20444]MDC7952867.1 DUF3290 family protein [Liquorilactobacillus mali]MDV7758295.1 DUF3290 family protein [Liquorilactobacillus mali]QFQ75385.1 DUF3290 domain-containing protein [Liquorilactobacillus mali]